MPESSAEQMEPDLYAVHASIQLCPVAPKTHSFDAENYTMSSARCEKIKAKDNNYLLLNVKETVFDAILLLLNNSNKTVT
jgi:hypothetical protein